MLRALTLLVVAGACASRPPATEQRGDARTGAWVFAVSGCARCHAESVFVACGHSDVPPARNLLTADLVEAFDVAARRQRDREPGTCRAIRDFARRWDAHRARIRSGTDEMPAWERREHRNLTDEADIDIDRVVGYLAGHGSASAEAALRTMRDQAEACVDPAPAHTPLARAAVVDVVERNLTGLMNVPSVEIESLESGLAENMIMIDQIARDQIEGLEVWFLRQREIGRNPVARFAIAVDRSLEVPRAYFVELDEHGKGVLVGAECFECHASGPRLIRPQLPSQVAAPSQDAWRQLAAWNRDIATQGAIEIELPTDEAAVRTRRLDVARCSLCHAPDSAIRTALFGDHLRAILVMMRSHVRADGFAEQRSSCERGLMPDGPGLESGERQQLGAWIADGCRGSNVCAKYRR